MSRTPGRRDASRLESTAEDAAVLFSCLLASPALPAAVAAATKIFLGTPDGSRKYQSTVTDATAAGVQGDASRGDIVSTHPTDANVVRGTTPATAAIAGLDWLSGVFRLGLACERVAPGEIAAALAAAPEATGDALAGFLAHCPLRPPYSGLKDGAVLGGRGAFGRRRSVALRSDRRASAVACWLGCRLLACAGRAAAGGKGAEEFEEDGYLCRRQWEALRRDCALQVCVSRRRICGSRTMVRCTIELQEVAWFSVSS